MIFLIMSNIVYFIIVVVLTYKYRTIKPSKVIVINRSLFDRIKINDIRASFGNKNSEIIVIDDKTLEIASNKE